MNKLKQFRSFIPSTRQAMKRSLATSTENCPKQDLDDLLERNKIWAQQKLTSKPKLFPSLATSQSPKILWIGCSDSRVPETEIFGSEPGEFFVHRNVANLVRHDDINLDAALEFAVEALKVNHIIVCGHYNCGGVKAALDGCSFSSVNKWILPLKESIKDDCRDLSGMSEEQAWRQAVHFNVLRSVNIIKKHPALQSHLTTIAIHPWVYDITTGIINPLTAEHNQVTNNKLYHHEPSTSEL